jgi:hypothetical protein
MLADATLRSGIIEVLLEPHLHHAEIPHGAPLI